MAISGIKVLVWTKPVTLYPTYYFLLFQLNRVKSHIGTCQDIVLYIWKRCFTSILPTSIEKVVVYTPAREVVVIVLV